MAKNIEQPELEIQQLIDAVIEDTPTEYTFRGKKRKMGWLHKGTTRKFTHIQLNEKDEHKRGVKQCVVAMLNNKWKILFFYAVLWRYYYYILDLDWVDVLGVLDVSKKKIQSIPSQLVIILATGMTDAMMAMTKREAEHTPAGQAGEPHSV